MKRIAMVAISKRLLFASLTWGLLGGLSSPAWAQSAVQTSPTPRTSQNGNASGTIAATGTFQKVFGATNYPSGPARYGCEIQNNGAASMDVSEGMTAATATAAKSHVIAAGGVWYCERAGAALQGEVDITGTATQTFYAVQY